MKVLVTGRGKSGSWQIRGAQLGHAIGATVAAEMLNPSVIKNFDVAIVVKRPRHEMVQQLQKNNVRIVWDIVDSWPQPEGNDWNRQRCMAWLQNEVNLIKPAGIVAPTEAMAADCKIFGIPTLALPHHAMPRLSPNPIRQDVRVVGYDGGPQYLGTWESVLLRECERRKWRFAINQAPMRPLDKLAEMDIVVALRQQSGYAVRSWKSNVKLANAQGTGTPIVCNREAGYIETRSGGEIFADTPDEVANAFDILTNVRVRKEASRKLFMAAPSIERIAGRYKAWLLSKFS